MIITDKCESNGLWSNPFPAPAFHQTNGILCLDKTRVELAAYYHATSTKQNVQKEKILQKF